MDSTGKAWKENKKTGVASVVYFVGLSKSVYFNSYISTWTQAWVNNDWPISSTDTDILKYILCLRVFHYLLFYEHFSPSAV